MKRRTSTARARSSPSLEALGEAGAVLIGGQCVNVWSQLYENEKQDPWRSARPYTSFDADVLSDKGEMTQIVGSLEKRGLSLGIQYPQSPAEATVNTGLIVTKVGGKDFGINLLHTAKGLSSAQAKSPALAGKLPSASAGALDAPSRSATAG